MQNCYISEILLCSHKEAKARKISFHPKMTVILAKNNAGKSVLLKSIYHAFGATVTFDRIWRDLYVTVLVRFKIEGRLYQILRWGNSCGLFDGNNLLITSFRVEKTGRLPTKLGEIFNFKMTWNNREGEAIIPPPAFMLMPYYIDQDISWASNWKSFDKLSVLTNWRVAIIEYHVGLKPNEYYEKKTKQLQDTKLYNERDKVLKLIRDTLKDIDSTLSKTDLNLDTEKFKEEIGQLIKECTTLQITQNKYKTTVNQLHSQKVAIEDQIKIVQTILGELRKDLTFAANELNDSIECPTCGAIYDNNFEERFAIARDEAECYELFNTLNEKKQKLQAEINNENNKLSKM